MLPVNQYKKKKAANPCQEKKKGAASAPKCKATTQITVPQSKPCSQRSLGAESWLAEARGGFRLGWGFAANLRRPSDGRTESLGSVRGEPGPSGQTCFDPVPPTFVCVATRAVSGKERT